MNKCLFVPRVLNAAIDLRNSGKSFANLIKIRGNSATVSINSS